MRAMMMDWLVGWLAGWLARATGDGETWVADRYIHVLTPRNGKFTPFLPPNPTIQTHPIRDSPNALSLTFYIPSPLSHRKSAGTSAFPKQQSRPAGASPKCPSQKDEPRPDQKSTSSPWGRRMGRTCCSCAT
ncbi:hypothetical protein IWX50DRAFT_638744 [Phyllosticta citricarpa]